jgi:hypothetical protein
MKIYLIGPPECGKDFEKVEKELRQQGHDAINPVAIFKHIPNIRHNERWQVAQILIDISDAVCLLPSWEASNVATWEDAYATGKRMDKILINQNGKSEYVQNKTIRQQNRSCKTCRCYRTDSDLSMYCDNVNSVCYGCKTSDNDYCVQWDELSIDWIRLLEKRNIEKGNKAAGTKEVLNESYNNLATLGTANSTGN